MRTKFDHKKRRTRVILPQYPLCGVCFFCCENLCKFAKPRRGQNPKPAAPAGKNNSGKELQSRAEAAIHHSPHRKYQKPTGCRTTHRPEEVRTGGALSEQQDNPPERNTIYAGYQYFRICQ